MDQEESRLQAQVRELLQQLEQARHSGDQRSQVRLLEALAEAWMQLRCPGKSAWFWQERLRVVESMGDLVEIVYTFANLGYTYGKPTGDRAKCLAFWRMAGLLGDDRMQQIVEECFAHARGVLGEQRFTRAWRKSERPYRWLQFPWRAEALPLLDGRCQLVGEPSTYPYFWVAQEGGSPAGDVVWQDAIQQGQQDLQLARRQKNGAEEALLLANLGCAYDCIGQTMDSRGCFEQALALFQKMGDAGGELETLCNLGTIEVNYRRFYDDLFLYHHSVAMHRAQERGDGHRLAMLYWQRGQACREDEFYQDALFWLEGALESMQGLGDKIQRNALLRELIWTRMEMGHYQKAIELGRQALELDGEREDTNGRRALLLFLLSMLDGTAGSFPEAEQSCHEAIALFQSIGNDLLAGQTLVHLGILCLWQGKKALADAYLKRGLALIPGEQEQATHIVKVLAERLTVSP